MAVWPLPRFFEHGNSVLWLSSKLHYNHYSKVTSQEESWYESLNNTSRSESSPLESQLLEYPSDIVQAAFERFRARSLCETFVPYKFKPRNTTFEPDLNAPRIYISEIIVEETVSVGEQIGPISKEAYAIHISIDGPVLINTVHCEGALRALETLAQLFYAHSKGNGDVYTPFAPAIITDAPAFAHRGLNLDLSRNWIPPGDVIRTIESMALNKLNKLHLHATDAQSWPIEIPSLPTLAQKGAYRDNQIWTVQDLKRVQKHGLYHGVEVYLEIDLPGHTASIHHSYPDLITAYNKPWAIYAQEPPAGQLKLNSPDVQLFLTKLFNDLLPRNAPFTTHFHVGGDELNLEAYNLDETIRSNCKQIIKPHLQRLMDHVLSLVQSHSLTPVIWEDMLLEWDLSLPSNTIVQTWRSSTSLAKVVEKGYRALFGPCEEWYLDCGYGTFIDPDPTKPDSPIKYPFHNWCGPYKNWRQILSFEPLKDIPLEQRHLVVGGEVHLWGELTDSVNLDNMLWPRTSAAAEVLWRGKGEVYETTTRRLAEM